MGISRAASSRPDRPPGKIPRQSAMNGEFGQIVHRVGRFIDRFEADELVPHPLKRFSLRFLGAGIWTAAFLHFFAVGGVYLYSQIDFEPMVEIEIMPYPAHLIDIIDPNKLVTAERGGGRPGRLEPPEDPGDDIMSKGVPVPVVVGIPEPIDDSLIAEEHEIASQEDMETTVAVALDTEDESSDEVGMGGSGVVGSSEAGSGIGGGMGDGSDDAWRFDTPPIPRRINMSISRKEIPRKLRHVKDSIVRFQLLINELGEVVDASIIESTGYDEIDELLLAKIFASRYHPATLKGRSVKAWIAVGYGYKLGR